MIFVYPYLSTFPSSFSSVGFELVVLNSEKLPLNFETKVLKGIGKFLSSKFNAAFFILKGPISKSRVFLEFFTTFFLSVFFVVLLFVFLEELCLYMV